MGQDSNVLVGIFDNRPGADQAVEALRQAGFRDRDIGFASKGPAMVEGGMITDEMPTDVEVEGVQDARSAIGGATAGAIIGAGLGAAATLLIPGVGPVLAAGILATALGYGAAGAAVGGIFGAMQGLGVSEEESLRYEHFFHAGSAIVAVHAGLREMEAASILRRHGAFNLHHETNDAVPLTGPADL